MAGPATEAIQRLLRQLSKLDEDRAAVVRAIEALRPAAEAEGLTVPNHSDNVAGMAGMHAVERLRHSKAPKRGSRTKGLIDAAHAKGYTLRSLAEKVGTSQAQLTFAAQGERPMSPELAKQIEKLTGFAATVANWPRLRSE